VHVNLKVAVATLNSSEGSGSVVHPQGRVGWEQGVNMKWPGCFQGFTDEVRVRGKWSGVVQSSSSAALLALLHWKLRTKLF
jgi:hypothetical protein